MGYVDLHSHVLPGIDDGVKTLPESAELLGLLVALGFDVVCATPHQKQGAFLPSREQIDQAFDAARSRAGEQHPTLELRLGAENFWDETFLERNSRSAQPRYTGENAFLFELSPPSPPPRLEDTLFAMRRRGILPVMAHPERYKPLCADKARMQTLSRQTALVVDLGALEGAHGELEAKHARWLCESGLAHAVATDVHSAADARLAASGMAWIKKKLGAAALTRLLDTHPRQILNGELPDPP